MLVETIATMILVCIPVTFTCWYVSEVKALDVYRDKTEEDWNKLYDHPLPPSDVKLFE